MSRRAEVGGIVLLIGLLLVVVVGVALVSFAEPAGAAPAATLSVFTGTVSLQRVGAVTTEAGRTGTVVDTGDSVVTGANSKAMLTYPDGSVTRLDSDTRVTVTVERAAAGAVKTSVNQSAGLTWNTVKRLLGASSFRVTGPNSATAAVRGTKFGYYVEHDPANHPVIWIDTYEGSVQVSGALGPAVTAGPNTRVTVKAGAAPTVPASIPAGDLQLSFTVFNQTYEAVTGTPFAFQAGALNSGQAAPTFTVAADGRSDLQFVLGWPGSSYQLTIADPAGKVVAQQAATTSPLSVVVRRAAAGKWKVTVRDLQSGPNEAWWVIVGRS